MCCKHFAIIFMFLYALSNVDALINHYILGNESISSNIRRLYLEFLQSFSAQFLCIFAKSIKIIILYLRFNLNYFRLFLTNPGKPNEHYLIIQSISQFVY